MQHGLDVRLWTIERACAAWCEQPPELQDAVDATVTSFGDSRAEVTRQLLRVARDMTSANLRRALLAQADGDAERLRRAPQALLHLVAATVPGLSVESVLWGLALGCHNACRPSRDDTTIRPFLRFLERVAPRLAARVELVSAPDWEAMDGAVVFGSDETIAMVRQRLGTRPVAGYGSRTGIAVVTEGAMAGSEGWMYQLVDDIRRFGQRGCMSPRRVYGVDQDPAELAAALAAALRSRVEMQVSPRELTRHVPEPYAARAASDAAALASIVLASPAGTTVPVHVDAFSFEVVGVRSSELRGQVAALGSHLQTAVACCAPDEREALAHELEAAGCTRVCHPGTAHEPPFSWRHDGIGRVAPLLG